MVEFIKLPDGRLYAEIGKSKIYIILPDITPEENERRWQETCRVASNIVYN